MNTLDDLFTYLEMKTINECWPWRGSWGGRARDRRPYFHYEGKKAIAYRLMYEMIHGVHLNPSQLILHSCDNGGHPVGCCNPAHLRIGDVKTNSHDMKTRERHGLSHHMVNSIRRMLAAGHTQQYIANMSGVSRETISAIATERVYAHVSKEKTND